MNKYLKNIKIKFIFKRLQKQNILLEELYEYKKLCKKWIKEEQYYYIHTDKFKTDLYFCENDIRRCKSKINILTKKLKKLGWEINYERK